MVNNADDATAERAGGRSVIERALEGMQGVARSINEMRRQHERAVRVQEIQSHLYGWDGADLTTLGQLVLEVRRTGFSQLITCVWPAVGCWTRDSKRRRFDPRPCAFT